MTDGPRPKSPNPLTGNQPPVIKIDQENLKKLIHKRGGLKGRLTVIKNYINKIKNTDSSKITSLEIKEVSLRLSTLHELMSKFDQVQCEIEEYSQDIEEQLIERELSENEFYSQIALAQEIVDSFSVKDNLSDHSNGSVKSSCCQMTNSIKLPTINLPTFDGSYGKWLEFKDTFESLIHTNDSIPPINKFHYLRNSLHGGASVVIKSIEFAARNYQLAWKTLCERFNNKNILINNHLHALVNINPIQKESFKALRYMVDQISKNMSSLNILEVPTNNWDPLIIYLASAKLDSITSGKWEEYKGRLLDLPTLEEFKEFLRNRANILETSHCNRSIDNNRHPIPNKEFKNTKSFLSSFDDSRKNLCLVCNQNHLIHQCNKFKNMSLEKRLIEALKYKLCNNCLRSGHKSEQCGLKGSCRVCKRKHNTLLHCDNPSTNPKKDETPRDENPKDDDPKKKGPDPSAPLVSLSAVSPGQVLLCTAQVEIIDLHNNTTYLARALLDTGSQCSFVTRDFIKKLACPVEKIDIFNISGINNVACQFSERCSIKIKSRINSFSVNVDCLVIPKITEGLPNAQIDINQLRLPTNVVLADPLFHKPSEVDILLGADKFFEIIGTKQIKLGANKPILQQSKLGWLVAGPIGENCFKRQTHCYFVKTQSQVSLQDIDNSMKKFWEVDELPSDNSHLYSVEEQMCENHFTENTVRLPDGRFSVTMPLKEVAEEALGNSFPLALRRFYNLEKKLDKMPKIKEQYRSFLKEYEELGHLNEIERPKFGCYLPHHCVIREQRETTKLRVVFDASAKTSSGKSLNDIQAIGPVVQSNLLDILLRFRVHRFVLTADVEKMYRQLALNESQRHLQIVLWRDHVDQPVRILQLNTVTYGTASAPFLSTRCLLQLAHECKDEIISNVIKNDFFIDDLNTGASTEEELKHIYTSVTQVLNSAQFPLRKFRTNCPQILDDTLGTSNCLDLNAEASVLGLRWSPIKDELHFPSEIEDAPKVTKRTIISKTCKLFDPLGLVSCCIIKAKILLQHLWSAKLDWDDPVPQEFVKRWLNFINNVHHLSKIHIPRYVLRNVPQICSIELHCFVDASKDAYGACTYLRSNDDKGNVTVQLLCAKARVAPIKKLTIPRLELSAALLGAQLCTKIIQSIPTNISEKFIWTDSTVVLCWLKTQTKPLQTFVRNRVIKINTLTHGFNWRHVPTNANPADLASRGVDPQNLQSNLLWWEGPPFLKEDRSKWPDQAYTAPSSLPEVKVLISIEKSHFKITFENHSSYLKIKRIYAYVLRFINNCNQNKERLIGALQVEELKMSEILLLKFSQLESFHKDINNIKNGKELHHKSKLLPLSPIVDANGLIRVGGRLEKAECQYDKKHPILLDATHHLTKLIMKYEHLRLLHAGPQLLLSSIRERFWPIGGRDLARAITKQCTICVRMRGLTIQPKMGDLPSVRVNPTFPFHSCGIDFCGPFNISSKIGRGNRITKAYICIFVCLAVKAIHLEAVSDLTTEAFILSLRRFISRRGKPYVIYCDNGRNFVGANNELGRVLKSSRQSVSNYAANEEIKFMFIPAYSPHFGGIWEAGVKSAKYHFKRVASNASLTFEELATVCAQIEAILNSRPLSPLSSDPTDLNPLTPGHFLIGRPLMSIPSLPVNSTRPNRYQRIEQIRQHFWERWRREFMAELQQRTKWRKGQKNLQVGDLVLLKEDNLMPLHWRMGRVTRLYPGHDGVCRVADISTSNGVIKRAVNKMCPLPSSDKNETSQTTIHDLPSTI